MSDEWTGCVHCGQTLPHDGTGWRESSRCRLFQRIAEQAWDEGYNRASHDCGPFQYEETLNPHHVTDDA